MSKEQIENAESEVMKEYFNSLNSELQSAYALANEARKKGFDPELKVDIPLAKNMAERVEGLISTVAPQLVGKGMIERIQELEVQYGVLDWRVALVIAEEIAKQKFCTFSSVKEAMEVGIRTGFCYHTLGIVAAPLEGFIEIAIKKRRDGKEYIAPKYAGPIRGAGGTAASVSVIITDFVRKRMGYSPYDPDEEEIARIKTEIMDYHERVTNLQYFPSQEEIDFMARHLPVEVSGDPTEDKEISQHKDLPRMETNMIRGGVCLVMAEGLCQKAPKVWKRLEKWGKEMDMDWDFLGEFLKLQAQIKSKSKPAADQGKEAAKLSPNYTFLKDMIAGRPVLTHPMRMGGFRLRYGRSRVSGYSSAGIHPVTQYVLSNYIAIGTQLKIERPGKAASMTACDTIDGPIVKLKNGTVQKLDTLQQYNSVKTDIKEILFLGDILFNYGDFSENNHKLVPAGYCDEWWIKELEKAMVTSFGSLDKAKLSEFSELTEEEVDRLFVKPNTESCAEECLKVSKALNIPLHPKFTPYWKGATKEQLIELLDWLQAMKVVRAGDKLEKLVIPTSIDRKRILEVIGLPHLHINNEFVVIESDQGEAFLAMIGYDKMLPIDAKKVVEDSEITDTLECINKLSWVTIRDKCGTFIGARMGRPEKAKMRSLTGSPHVLFPVGDEGGRLRSFQAAMQAGNVTADFPLCYCPECGKETIYNACEICGGLTQKKYVCKTCGIIEKKCPHEDAKTYQKRAIDIKYYFEKSLMQIGIESYPDLIKGVRGTSNGDHTPEHLSKGILRAKHSIYVNKDGTTRYDMSELPITHFRPKEIGTSIEKLREMGYTKDIHGVELEDDNQILEIRCQDVILPGSRNTPDEPANTVLFRIAQFIDDEMVSLYGMKPFYNLKNEQDIIGHLVIGLAPHISAGTIGRIIGFSSTQGMLTHPLFHAAMRRDCDGDEACVILLMDAFLNFSRKFLPDKRGGRTMDAPLVLTSKLIPSEVDDMALGLDVVWTYPLEFYEAADNYLKTGDIKIEQIKDRINKPSQYEGMGFTHDVSNFNTGVRCSAYKTLPSMEDKLKGQMEIAERVRAVDETDVATLVIEKHFIKDIKGNMRKFSMQEFRCVKCNEKFRRPPLAGKCDKCGGKLIFTISEGSVVKYLEPSISIAEKYGVHPYLMQTLELVKRRIESSFGKEKERQEGLGRWF